MGRHNVHEPKDSIGKEVSAPPKLFPIKMPVDYRHKRLLPDLFEKKKGRWTRVIDLVWERMEWDGLVLLQVAVADTVWY